MRADCNDAATISATFLTTSWFLPNDHSIRRREPRDCVHHLCDREVERFADRNGNASMELFKIRNAPPIPASISRAVLSAMPFDFFRSASSFLVSVTVFPMAEALVMPIKPKTSLKAWARSPVPMLADAVATSPRMSTRSLRFLRVLSRDPEYLLKLLGFCCAGVSNRRNAVPASLP